MHMKTRTRRLAALLLAGGLLLPLASCKANEKDTQAGQTALTVNGQEIAAGEYAANYLYSKLMMEQMMAQYGISDPWEGDAADAYKEQVAEQARKSTELLYIIPAQFEAAGLELTAEESAGIENASLPGLAELGFTAELSERLARCSIMIQRLDEHYFGEGGIMSPEESEIEDYFQQHYYRAKHILVSARDESGQPIEDDAELAKLEQKAQELAQRAAAGEDFDALVREYGEDPGMSANPDGYQFTDGEMVAEFQNATAALAENAISAPVRSDFGWHIIQRLPLQPEGRAEAHSAIVTALTGMNMDRLMDQWIAEADIQEAPLFAEITFDTVKSYRYGTE